MPAPTAQAVASLAEDDEDLSDEQVQALLLEAEVRLRENASAREVAVGREKAADFKLPSLASGEVVSPRIYTNGKIARLDPAIVVASRDRELARHDRKVEDPVVVKNRQVEEKRATTGPMWYNLPRTDLTPELKRDLQLLKMRNVLDPKRHYKKEGGNAKGPEYAQIGTIIEGNTDYFSARINKKDRKRTFVEEVLAGEGTTGRFKRKYDEIQAVKTSGKKTFYKALKAKRKSGVAKR